MNFQSKLTMEKKKNRKKRIFVITIGFVYCLLLGSCIRKTGIKVDFSEDSFSFEKMDTNFIDKSLENQKNKYNSLAFEDIDVGHRLLLHSIPKEIINAKKIFEVKDIESYVEKYDSLGYMTYEKYITWDFGTNYIYRFDRNGKPLFLSAEGAMAGTAKYKYDGRNKLLFCGTWKISYYPNGFKKSVENSEIIEIYEYDTRGNICHIYFKNKPGVKHCWNSSSEWFGEYDNNNRLVRDLTIESPFPSSTIYEYSKDGFITKSARYIKFRDGYYISDYYYKKHVLTIKTREQKIKK